MAREEYNPVPSVSPGEPAGQYENIQANPSDFPGGLEGPALQHLGAATEQTGDQLAQNAVRMQDLNNQADSRNQIGQFLPDVGKAWSQYGTLEGKAAADALPAFMQNLQDIQKQHASQLTSPVAREDFMQASSYLTNRLTLMASTHAAEQQKAYWQTANKSNITNMEQAGVFYQNDPKTVDAAAASIVQSVQEIGNNPSVKWDPATLQANTSLALGKYYRTVIEAQMQTNPMIASQTFDRIKGSIDGVSSAEIERSLRPALDNFSVNSKIDQITGGGVQHGAPIANQSLPKEAQQFLPVLAWGEESNGYSTPAPKGDGSGTPINNNRYQFLASTWRTAAPAAGANVNDTSNATQDTVAWTHAQNVYQQNTGRSLQNDLSAGGHEDQIATALNKVWPSLPGGSEQNTTMAQFKQRMDQMRNGGPIPQSGARDNAIAPRYFDEMRMVQNAFNETTNMRPDLAERVRNGVLERISKMNSLENGAEANASRNLANSQRDNEATLFGAAVMGQPIPEGALGNYVRTQAISTSGYNAIKTIQQKQAEGNDNPLPVMRLWQGIEDGSVTSDNIFQGVVSGDVRGTTANDMIKALGARSKTTNNAVERGDYETLKTALGGHALESGAMDIFGEQKLAHAQLWAQAQGEWNKRVTSGREQPDAVLSDMMPRYQKSIPSSTDALPFPRFGQVKDVEDVADIAGKTKAAFQGGQISQDTYNAEGDLLDKYRRIFQLQEQQKGAALRAPKPNTKPVPLTPSGND